MKHQVHISARFRKEPDYGKLARALLALVEEIEQQEAEAEQDAADKKRPARKEQPAEEDQP
jgi:hypothetical protein